jgi:hypothetical protein
MIAQVAQLNEARVLSLFIFHLSINSSHLSFSQSAAFFGFGVQELDHSPELSLNGK